MQDFLTIWTTYNVLVPNQVDFRPGQKSLSKAYDQVDREFVCTILERYMVLDEFLNLCSVHILRTGGSFGCV